MSNVNIYKRFFEYQRIVTDIVITDEGIFYKNEVPEDYGGAQLELKLVAAVLMVNSKAELIVHEFNVDSPMDRERKKDGPIVRDGNQIREATGDSTTPWVQYTVTNSKLDPERAQLGAFARQVFDADIQATIGQTPT